MMAKRVNKACLFHFTLQKCSNYRIKVRLKPPQTQEGNRYTKKSVEEEETEYKKSEKRAHEKKFIDFSSLLLPSLKGTGSACVCRVYAT